MSLSLRCAIVAIAIVVAGCLPRPQAPSLLRIDDPEANPIVRTKATPAAVVQILPFSAGGGARRRVVSAARNESSSLTQLAGLQWDASPARYAERAIARHLESQFGELAVLEPWQRGDGRLWIDGQLERFEIDPESGRANVRLRMLVLDARCRTPVLKRTYAASEAIEIEAGSLATGFARALDLIGNEFATDVAPYLDTASMARERKRCDVPD